MKFKGPEAYNVLVARGVDLLFHANSVTTSCTFLEQKGLPSRGYVENLGLPQTDQITDAIDKKFGIWNDVFTDGVDVHYRGGKRKGANQYGPVLFKIPVATLKNLPTDSCVMVTKINPFHWEDGEPATERYFASIAELKDGYNYGDFGQHIVIRTKNGILPFGPGPVLIDLDDPKRKLRNGQDAYSAACKRLLASGKKAGLTIELARHKCQTSCKCVEKYATSATFDTMF